MGACGIVIYRQRRRLLGKAQRVRSGRNPRLSRFLCLPPVFEQQAQALRCTHLTSSDDDTSFLLVDTSVQCSSARYHTFLVCNALVLVLNVLSLAGLAWLVLRHRHALNPPKVIDSELRLQARDTDASLAHIQFLVRMYRCEAYYFDVAFM